MTTMSSFKKATREKLKGRIALDGISGGGKTFTALRAAFTLGQKVAVIDTENRSASKYVGTTIDGVKWDFDVCELSDFAPPHYTSKIREAEEAGYDVIVIDSLSHAWVGEGGVLDLKDRKGGTFDAWKDITPLQRRMVDSIIHSTCHVIVTMRTKTEYVVEKKENGKTTVRKVGLAPVQRDGLEYEFDAYLNMADSMATVSKTRCPHFYQGMVELQPGREFFGKFKSWLEDGAEVPMISAQSREIIDTLKKELGVTDAVFDERLFKLYGVRSVVNLTDANAKDMIDKMQAKRRPKSETTTEPQPEPAVVS
jgi:hypothetical protein